ncbi:MAG: hypothetical protein OXC30_05110 [Alphaproteobacteria bacterium]|nr:hypothetical protein [Alphaproteobacteria bacterium]
MAYILLCNLLLTFIMSANVLEEESQKAFFMEERKKEELMKEKEHYVLKETEDQSLFGWMNEEDRKEEKDRETHVLTDEGGLFDGGVIVEESASKNAEKTEKKKPLLGKIHRFKILNVSALWRLKSCDGKTCILEVDGEDFPQFSFMGIEGRVDSVEVTHQQISSGWRFFITFSTPIELQSFSVVRESVELVVAEKIVQHEEEKSSDVESVFIRAVSESRANIVVSALQTTTLDVQKQQGEVVIILPQDSNLASHVPLCQGDFVRGCYVQQLPKHVALHFLLTQGVYVANIWTEKDEDNDFIKHKISLKKQKMDVVESRAVFAQGIDVPLFNVPMQPQGQVMPVREQPAGMNMMRSGALSWSDTSDPFAESAPPVSKRAPIASPKHKSVDKDDEGWSESEPVDVNLSETRYAQTSDQLSSARMKPDWLLDAQRAFSEQKESASQKDEELEI